ncbi:MAG: amidohydrolase family protein [Lachnospiraceae bacterium]|nr:amidohydrolase family protein [Lachnospiraceae bacterium]
MLDYLIKNGLIMNGRKEPAFMGSVAVKDGKIAGIGHIEPPGDLSAVQILDADGAWITPGFVDIHRHGDLLALHNGDDELLNRQGITTVVNGNCGLSAAPAGTTYRNEILPFLSSVIGVLPERISPECLESMGSYMRALSTCRRSVNTGMLVGNGTVLASVSGYRVGAVQKQEIEAASLRIEEGLAAGALGVSIGLAYAPEFRYKAATMKEVLRPLAGKKIPLLVHIRNEGDGLYEAVLEMLDVARALHIPLHISHMKCIGRRNWRRLPAKVMEAVTEARNEGLDVSYDLYPYITGSTQLVHLLPPYAQEGGTEAIVKRLSDPEERKKLVEVLSQPSSDFENIVDLVGFEGISVSTLHSDRFRRYEGSTLAEIAEAEHTDGYSVLFDLLIEEKCMVPMLDTFGCEEDLRFFYADPRAAVISDAIYPSGGKVHPRVYAAFPRFLIEHVREHRDLAPEDAIYRMTALPSETLSMDCGVLEIGKAADLNVFRLSELRAPADFDDPYRFCEGFRLVMVGGEPVVMQDRWLGGSAGRIIRR